MDWYIVGLIAAVLTTFGFVPQILKMRKTKSVNDVSLPMLYQYALGVFLWALYGMHLGDYIIIGANIVSFITLVATIALYYHYGKKPEK
ncbi:MAG TPA: hypothetical protein HA257_00585 [Candidatus Methanoperedenaceae archaeon]|nr:hypothetical protein [Candidatus Methanoperedenaceae archaeon]